MYRPKATRTRCQFSILESFLVSFFAWNLKENFKTLQILQGPTLLKANEDSLAAVLEIKFNNLVIEILIENYELIFKTTPGKSSDYV